LQLAAGLESRLSCLLVLLASVYALARLLVAILLLRAQAEAERDLELLALRHEVAILRRHVKRPELLPTDRLLLATLGRRLPVGRLLFTPAAVLRWHRELVRRRWSAFGGRPVPLAPGASVRRSPYRRPWINKRKESQRPAGRPAILRGAVLPPLRPAPALDRDPDSPRSRRRSAPRRGAGAAPPAWGTRTPSRAPALA